MVRILTLLICSFVMVGYVPLQAEEKGGGDQKEQSSEQSQVRSDVKRALESQYPVAIAKGESVNVDYAMPEKGAITFKVTDFRGEKHFGFTETFEAGDNTISFNTFGLDVGNYFVEISSPQKEQEKEMMVTVVK